VIGVHRAVCAMRPASSFVAREPLPVLSISTHRSARTTALFRVAVVAVSVTRDAVLVRWDGPLGKLDAWVWRDAVKHRRERCAVASRT
jgi:hypothetical protein